MGRSYDEQRMAELVYAEEYRRRLRRERAAQGFDTDADSEGVAEARAAAYSASDELIRREREAAVARRARTEEILGRAAATGGTDEWTPVATRRGDNGTHRADTSGAGIDFEPITRGRDTTETSAAGAVGDTSSGKPREGDAPLSDSGVGIGTTTEATETEHRAPTEAPTYRVVLDGDLSAHRIEIGGMEFTAVGDTGAAVSADFVAQRAAATVREADTGAVFEDVRAKDRGGARVADTGSTVEPLIGDTDREPLSERSAPRAATATDDARPHRRGIVYADYGMVVEGREAPFAAYTEVRDDGGRVRMEAPRDSLGLADKPIGARGATTENLDTPPAVSTAGGARRVDFPTTGRGRTEPPIEREIDGDIDYVGSVTEEPEYEYDGGITRRGRATDIPAPRADEEEDFGRILREEKRRRREGGATPDSDGTRIYGAGTHVPYDGRVVEEPLGVGGARAARSPIIEEEEYRRILGTEGGRVDVSDIPIGGSIIEGVGTHVPYDGSVVDEPEGVGRAAVVDPTMLEQEDMLAFSRYYEERDAATASGDVTSGIDYVGGYDMPPEERGGDIPRHDTPYIAPPIEEREDVSDIGRDERLDRAAMRREMERDMTEFIRATDRAERERHRRAAGSRGAPTTTEPSGTEGAPIYDKRALSRRVAKYTTRDMDLIDARIGSQIAALEARREAADMTFSEPDRASKRDRKKLVRELKILGKRLTRAKKFEKKDNERYFALVMSDLARVKLPEGADAERLIEARERAIALLERRDELNARLAELYRGAATKSGSRGVAAREAAARRGRMAEYKKQMRLERRIRGMKVAYDYRKRLEELMDAAVSCMGEIKLYEHILHREKPHGRAKREAKAALSDAIRAYKKNKKEIARISDKAFRMAKDKKRQTKGAIAGWIALAILAAIIGVCVWQWNTIWEFILTQVPILGEIFDKAVDGGAVK